MILNTDTPVSELRTLLGDDLPFVLEAEVARLEVEQIPKVFDRFMEVIGILSASQLLTSFNRAYAFAGVVTSALYEYRVGGTRPYRDIIYKFSAHPRKKEDPQELLAKSQAIAAKYVNKESL